MHVYVASRFLLGSIFKNRRLLLEMTRRDIFDRYAGQVLGPVWAVFHPIVTICVFIFMFAVVFRVKADTNIDIPGDHTLYMLSGLVPWLVMADVLGRSTTIISSQASLVKQVVFPIEILPVKMVLATLPTFLIGTLGLFIYALFAGRMSPALLLYPLASLPFYLFLIGLAFILSALGVFLKDTKEFVQIYALIGMYMTPIFYFIDWVPTRVQLLLFLNPTTFFVEIFHDAVYYGGIRSWLTWFVAVMLSCIFSFLGASLFYRWKPHFGSFL